MDFDHDDVRPVVTEDRLSSLPDELIHQILSCFDTKFAVQTCLLSRRWKLLWRSMPYLNFASYKFKNIPKFSKFVTNVLSRRNRQVEVFSVKLDFRGSANHLSVRKIANYAFSHNAQELTIVSWPKDHPEFPHCLFSSQSLKHLTFSTGICTPCLTPITPWDFPALTTLHLNDIKLCDTDTRESVDLFSKCVNLKNLTLKAFTAYVSGGFNIIAPRLSNLMLIHGRCSSVVKVIAPQLENLTIIHCPVKYLNAPSGISSLCYRGERPPKLPKDPFHCVNKVTLTLSLSQRSKPYKEDDALETINLLQELRSAKFLTLNLDIVECLSQFSDLVSHLPSPFSNLISLNIDSSREEPYKVKISAEARSFLLENSPTATVIMDLPEEPLTKARKAKEARERKKAELITSIESQMSVLEASLAQENISVAERKQAREKTKAALENLMAEQEVLAKNKMMQLDPKQPQESAKNFREELSFLMAQIEARLDEMRDLGLQEIHNIVPITARKDIVILLLEKLPKRQRAVMEARYSPQFEKIKILGDYLKSTLEESIPFYRKKITDALEKNSSSNFSASQDVSSRNLPMPSQPSSPSALIPTPSTSSINQCSEPPTQGS